MNPAPRSRTYSRLVALVLASLFLLQSAAVSADGCWRAMWGGGCCCASETTGSSEASLSGEVHRASAPRSCCAVSTQEDARGGESREEDASGSTVAASRDSKPHAPASTGPEFGRKDSCGCKLAPLPSAPAQSWPSTRADDRTDEHGAFADWIARGAPIATDLDAWTTSALQSPPTGPPRERTSTPATSIASRRLASRGVIGLLSGLCTSRT